MYKTIGVMILAASALIATGCGSSNGSGSGNITGTWNATLTDTNGIPVYKFSTMFTQNSDGTLSVTNFTFTTAGPCFSPYSSDQYSETGSFGLTGNFNGQVNGTFGMTVTTLFPATTTNNNVLTLQGTVTGGTITGTWKATGFSSGCSGNGNFTATAG